MWQFFKSLFTILLALTIFTFVGIMILVGVMSASNAPKIVESNSILKLTFDKPIAEVSSDNPLESLGLPISGRKESIGLNDIKKSILHAKTDSNIKGIYLNLNSLKAGFASVQEIRNALIDFKKSRKFIYAYSDNYSEGGYYLSSVADKIFLSPEGMLEFNGIGVQVLYFKNLFEKLEIKAEVFKAGNYKSAVEPFILDKMSDNNRNQLDTLLGGIYGTMLQEISASRKLKVADLKLIADSMKVHNSADAINYKLITNLGYYDQLEVELKKKVGIHGTAHKLKFIGLEDYSKTFEVKEGDEDKKVAVIVASGEIRQGENANDVIGSESVCSELRRARNDPKVKAIVLRINSPGGSSLASDLMWREIVITRKVKPVIASMSDMAASGGYYMAMACDKIVAHPTTITGSIGVFGIMFNIKNALANKLGINADAYNTGKFTDVGNTTRELTDYERTVIQSEVDHTYEEFLRKAAEGRKTNVENIRKVAGGRVWTGAQAKDLGLVDAIGGVQEAITIAANMAKLGNDYSVKYIPESKKWLDAIFENAEDEKEAQMMASELGEFYPFLKTMQKLKYMQGVQARTQFELILE